MQVWEGSSVHTMVPAPLRPLPLSLMGGSLIIPQPCSSKGWLEEPRTQVPILWAYALDRAV